MNIQGFFKGLWEFLKLIGQIIIILIFLFQVLILTEHLLVFIIYASKIVGAEAKLYIDAFIATYF